jgi:hypothetical protein
MTENSTPQTKLARLREIVTETPANVVPLRPTLAHMITVASEPPEEMHGLIGSLLQFDKGTYFKGRKEKYVTAGKTFRIYNSTDAWRYMNNGIKHERTIWRGMVEPFLKRSDLGDLDQSQWPVNPFNGRPDDPWKHTYFGYLYETGTGEYLTFVTHTSGGERAFKELARAVRVDSENFPVGACPLIELSTDTFDTKLFQNVQRPKFPIVGWVDEHGRPLNAAGPVIDGDIIEEVPATRPILKRPTLQRGA